MEITLNCCGCMDDLQISDVLICSNPRCVNTSGFMCLGCVERNSRAHVCPQPECGYLYKYVTPDDEYSCGYSKPRAQQPDLDPPRYIAGFSMGSIVLQPNGTTCYAAAMATACAWLNHPITLEYAVHLWCTAPGLSGRLDSDQPHHGAYRAAYYDLVWGNPERGEPGNNGMDEFDYLYPKMPPNIVHAVMADMGSPVAPPEIPWEFRYKMSAKDFAETLNANKPILLSAKNASHYYIICGYRAFSNSGTNPEAVLVAYANPKHTNIEWTSAENLPGEFIIVG